MRLSHDQALEIKCLIQLKLLNVRISADGKMAILKYSKRAFWSALWHTNPFLKETRGMIVSWPDCRTIISYPFTKVFNLHEPGAPSFADDEKVVVVKKVNGFLGVATWHEGKLIVTSSGTFDSEFANMAKQYLDNAAVRSMCQLAADTTFMFEIVHPDDPHIVRETPGAWLIGARRKALHSPLESEAWLTQAHYMHLDLAGIHRPGSYHDTFGEVKNSIRSCQHEGFMIRALADSQKIAKMKSPHYLTLKFLARSGKLDKMWDDAVAFSETVDEDFAHLIPKIVVTLSFEMWSAMNEQERLAFMKTLL
jgi:hypothetical protein